MHTKNDAFGPKAKDLKRIAMQPIVVLNEFYNNFFSNNLEHKGLNFT